MDHKAEIHQLLEHPRAEKNALSAKLALENPEFLAVFIEQFANPNYEFNHRCGWIIRKVAQKNKALLLPYSDTFILVAKTSTNYKVVGSAFYLIDCLLGPTEKIVELLDVCLKQLLEPTGEEADYTATYTMKILGKIAKVEPAFTHEIVESILIAKTRYTKSYTVKTVNTVLKELQQNRM